MDDVKYIMAGAFTNEDWIAVNVYNERVKQFKALQQEIRDCEYENSRPLRTTMFTVESKVYRPTFELRAHLVTEKRELLLELERISKIHKGDIRIA